jgi:hypothetical protein
MAYRIDMKEIAFLEDIFSDMDIQSPQNPEQSGPGNIGEVMAPPGGVFLLVNNTEVFFLTRVAKAA